MTPRVSVTWNQSRPLSVSPARVIAFLIASSTPISETPTSSTSLYVEGGMRPPPGGGAAIVCRRGCDQTPGRGGTVRWSHAHPRGTCTAWLGRVGCRPGVGKGEADGDGGSGDHACGGRTIRAARGGSGGGAPG